MGDVNHRYIRYNQRCIKLLIRFHAIQNKTIRKHTAHMLLTNRPGSFCKTVNFLNMFKRSPQTYSLFFSPIFWKDTPKFIQYRKYMTFNETIFLYELDQELSREEMYNNNKGMFSSFIKTF